MTTSTCSADGELSHRDLLRSLISIVLTLGGWFPQTGRGLAIVPQAESWLLGVLLVIVAILLVFQMYW